MVLLLFMQERKNSMSLEEQKLRLERMMKYPIPKHRIGIVHLQMVKDGRTLNGMKRFTNPKEAVEMVKPLFEMADREMVLVLSLNTKLEPMALEIAAVGALSGCMLDVKSIFKHALLNNAAYVVCFHNHVSGYAKPSREDKKVTEKLSQAGKFLDLPLLDHIIIGEEAYFSFREAGELTLEQEETCVAEEVV